MLDRGSTEGPVPLGETSIQASTVRSSCEHFTQTISALVSSPDDSLLPRPQPTMKRSQTRSPGGALVGAQPYEVCCVPD